MIGIFDSGVGGMTVARAIEQLCPGLPFIYLGDIARTPYGSKSSETIIRYSMRNTDFLLEKGAILIVIACNSASSTAAQALRDHYDIPIIDVISPAAEKAARTSTNGRIGVVGTRATIDSDVYRKRIQDISPNALVHGQACPLFVPLVEEGWLSQRETKMIVKKYLQPLRGKQVDTLVLGCTHYPLLKDVISPRIGKGVSLIDSSIETAHHLKNFLDKHPEFTEDITSTTTSHFYVTDLTQPAQSLANKIFGRKIELEKTDV